MKTKKITAEEYQSPSMNTIQAMPYMICSASGDSTHEGVGYDDDDALFGDDALFEEE